MEPEPAFPQLVRQAAELLVRYPFTPWRYGDSVGFEGLLAASDFLGDDRYAGWVHGALRAWAATREAPAELDNTIPGHGLCLAYERTGDPALLQVGREVAADLRSRPKIGGVYVSWSRAPLREPSSGAPLTPEEQALLADPGPGVFLDCLHFDPPFFAHLGQLTGDGELVDDGAAQALGYVSLLQQPNGLFDHFWLETTQRSHGPGWGRGQGWALLGLIDVLTYLPIDHRHRPALEASARALAGALIKTQRPSGGWGAAVEDGQATLESSTAAFVAAGFPKGQALGVLDADVLASARDAWAATLRLVDHGALQQVSVAIWPSTGSGHYAHPQVGSVVPWGQGPLLLAARQMARAITPSRTDDQAWNSHTSPPTARPQDASRPSTAGRI